MLLLYFITYSSVPVSLIRTDSYLKVMLLENILRNGPSGLNSRFGLWLANFYGAPFCFFNPCAVLHYKDIVIFISG